MTTPRPILCIGGAVVDRLVRTGEAAKLHTSNIGVASGGVGGSARNVAENLARLGAAPRLVSCVGEDEDGRAIRNSLVAVGVDASDVHRAHAGRTANYTAVFSSDGELVIGVADMAIFAHITPDLALAALRSVTEDTLVYFDANLPPETIDALVAARPARLAANAVSRPKSEKLRRHLGEIDYLFLNLQEAAGLFGEASLSFEAAPARFREANARAVFLTDGANGVSILTSSGARLLPSIPARQVINVNGAGDAFCAATLFRLARGATMLEAAQYGLAAGSLAVESEGAVHPALSPAVLEQRLREARA